MKAKAWAILCLLAVVTTVSTAGAQAPELEVEEAKKGGSPVGRGLWRLAGDDPFLGSSDDLAPLRRMVGKATVVGLGEGWHTSGGFYKMKHRIFRDLVENKGFRVFAIETHWAAGEKANQYVQTCQGDPKEAIDLHMSVWHSQELIDLVQWMCEWNQTHPDDRVHYFGFDIQLPDLDAAGLIAFLGRIGIPQRHAWVEGIRQCEGVTRNHYPDPIPAEVHQQCMAALTAIDGHFKSNGESIRERTSNEDFELADLRLLSLMGWQEQVFYIGDDYAGEDFARGFNSRDAAMAEVFFRLRDKHFPKAKTVVWAANIHVARALVPNGARPIGSFLADRLGSNYVNFALVAWRSELDYFGECLVQDAVSGSAAERLHALGEDFLLVDLARSNYIKPRVQDMAFFHFLPRQHFSGIVYQETSEYMTPTDWKPCRP